MTKIFLFYHPTGIEYNSIGNRNMLQRAVGILSNPATWKRIGQAIVTAAGIIVTVANMKKGASPFRSTDETKSDLTQQPDTTEDSDSPNNSTTF